MGILKELPQEIDGFKLTMGQGIDGQILTIASYSNEAMHSKLGFDLYFGNL